LEFSWPDCRASIGDGDNFGNQRNCDTKKFHLIKGEKIMTYATISTWKANSKIEDEDAMYKVVQEKYVPALKAMGASQAMWVQTGEGEIAIISVYPDEATCNAADAKRAEVRSQGSSEFDATLTGEMRGEVRASG
jgi:hypothetical protein